MNPHPQGRREIAHLARLAINEDELATYVSNLSKIVTFVAQLDAADTSQVEPMAHPLSGQTQRLRPDEVTERDLRERFQKNAPRVEAGLYLVPKVIENARTHASTDDRTAVRGSPAARVLQRRALRARCWRESRRLNGPLNAFITVTKETALAAVRRADEALKAGRGGPAHRRPDRAQGHLLHRRHPHHLRFEDPRQFRRPTTRPWSSGCTPRARCCSARPTWTSSRWAVQRDQLLRTGVQSLDLKRVPGGSSGGSAAAVAARTHRPPPAPTPAARSVS